MVEAGRFGAPALERNGHGLAVASGSALLSEQQEAALMIENVIDCY